MKQMSLAIPRCSRQFFSTREAKRIHNVNTFTTDCSPLYKMAIKWYLLENTPFADKIITKKLLPTETDKLAEMT